MRRREFITLVGSAVAWPLGAHAQQKIPRIGFMGNSTAALETNLVDAFREGLRELGYEEGRNIAIEYRWADGNYDRFPTLAEELIAARVDAIVTAGTPAALAVKRATTTVPLVMVAVGDPIGTGCVEPSATWGQSDRIKLNRARSRGQTAPTAARSRACAFTCRDVR
jgi:putative ABC transport system substrate-binding protein